ncbi:MAG: 4Fe-4S binding protein [Anaerolineae bacterium]|nr:4Fe-4S binding protein [Anaerolineae bacterium]
MSTEETADSSAVPVSNKKSGAPRPRGHVSIFGTWCKGCGICIEFCPQKVFESNGQGRTKVAHPERCTACMWCSTHCPDMAITVRRLEPEEIEELERLAEMAQEGVLPVGGGL